jgi:hypothetical protein
VELWWPNGHGKQKLYDMNVEIVNRNVKSISKKSLRFGFRTIKLVENDVQGGKGRGVKDIGLGKVEKRNVYFFRLVWISFMIDMVLCIHGILCDESRLFSS